MTNLNLREVVEPLSAGSYSSGSEDSIVSLQTGDVDVLLQAAEQMVNGSGSEIADSLRKDLIIVHERVRNRMRHSRRASSPRMSFRPIQSTNNYNIRPLMPSHSTSIPPALMSPSKIGKKRRPTKTGAEMSVYRELDLTNKKHLDEYYENRFTQMQQLNCKEIAKAWIKAVEPKKQSQYPYNSKHTNKGKRPPWWPHECAYVEPDHLKKPDRVRLLVAMLHLRIKPISVYEKATRDLPNRISQPENNMPLLEELYMVAKAVERLETEGEACPVKVVRIGKSAEAVRNAKKLKDEQYQQVERMVNAQLAYAGTMPVSPPNTPSDTMGHDSPSPAPHDMSIRDYPQYAPPSAHMLIQAHPAPYGYQSSSTWAASRMGPSLGTLSVDYSSHHHAPQHSPTDSEDVYSNEPTTCGSMMTPSTGGHFPGFPEPVGLPSSTAEEYHSGEYVTTHQAEYDVSGAPIHPHIPHPHREY